MNSRDGLILLDKPPGITSFNALGKLKKELGTGKVGHTGTLDKFAQGLIVALSGKMTKLVPQFTGLDKKYEALIRFGEETETLDPEGKIIASAPVPSYEQIISSLDKFRGKIMQSPPMFSAVHINGKRAYERAVSGEKVEMPEREIEIYSFEVSDWQPPFLKTEIHCSKGTYIRSLARDLALECGSRAHLQELKRTTVGPFDLSEAISADLFRTDEHLIRPWTLFDALAGVEKVIVDRKYHRDIKMGKMYVLSDIGSGFKESIDYALFDEDHHMLALVQKEKGRISYRFVC